MREISKIVFLFIYSVSMLKSSGSNLILPGTIHQYQYLNYER